MPARTLQPVSKQSAVSQATENLRTFILSGSLEPGARLKEIQLSEELGVARSTLRSSLSQLAGEGIVVQIPYTGWQVMELSADDVWELWTLRGSLESLASKLAAERMNSDIEGKIEGALQRLVEACGSGDVSKASDADFSLHRTIIDCVGHRRLADQYRQVEQQVRFYIASSNELVSDNLLAVVGQHDRLIEALLARDPIRAADEAWRHNESEGGKLVAAIRRKQKAKSKA
jgi:DNA-binding GntR family transcriptional regulator